MSYVLDISTRAKRDIDDIAAWYLAESQSMEVATNWYNGIIKSLHRLVDLPESHSLIRENDLFPFDVRQMLYGSGKRKTHRALFRIEGEAITVLAIRHLSQDDVTPDDIQ